MKAIVTFVSMLGMASFAFAAERSVPAAITPEVAGADFAVQGEYEGMAGQDKAGIQVMALGGGKFHAVGYRGGLPGAGWNEVDKNEADAQLQDGAVVFERNGASLIIKDGKAVAKFQNGDTSEFKRIVRESPTLGAKPPQGAIVLFDGSGVDAFKAGAKMDDRKLLCAGAFTKQNFENFTLHLEFILPFMPAGKGQARANSGVYIQNRYEIQILDSFGNEPADSGDCGAIYRQVAPKLNMCLPPLQWQTYDIDFTAPKWQDGKKTENARVTVKLNGVVVQDNQEIKTKTGAGKPEGPEPGPIQLQLHGNPVFFRNVWIVQNK